MKKIIVFLFILTSFALATNKEDKNILNSNNMIRFRIIAPSNETQDQALKLNIRDSLLENLKNIEDNSQSISSTREAIKKEIPKMEEKLDQYNVPYTIKYGNNYFPSKTYQGITYPESEYESLVINLAEGNGDNWWCILFPPLCLIEAQKDNLSEVKYDWYIKEVISKFS